jgi:hypothetical protein
MSLMEPRIMIALLFLALILGSCDIMERDGGSIVVNADEGTIIYINDRAVGTVDSSGTITIPDIKDATVSLRAVGLNNENIVKSVSITPKESVIIDMRLNTDAPDTPAPETVQHLFFRIYADSEGEFPLPGARIRVWNASGHDFIEYTDSSGAAVIRINQGIWNYEVSHEEFDTLRNTVNVGAGAHYVERIQMEYLSPLPVVLQTMQGTYGTTPVTGVSIRLWNHYGKSVVTATDSRGIAQISLEPGLWNFDIISGGLEIAAQVPYIEVGPAHSNTYRIGLIPSAAVPIGFDIRSGTASGTRVAGATITLRNSHGNEIIRITDSTGPLTINLAPGRWSYTITAVGYETRHDTIDVSGQLSYVLALAREPGKMGVQTIEVRSGHYSHGTLLSGAIVTVTQPSGATMSMTTGTAGTVTFTGEVGEWSVKVLAQGHNDKYVAARVTEWDNGIIQVGLPAIQELDAQLTVDKEVVRTGEEISYVCTVSGGAGYTTVSINFGDNHNTNVAHGTHSYTAPGTYTISCVVYDGVGSSVTRTRNLVVEPIMGCTLSNEIQCVGHKAELVSNGVRLSVILQNFLANEINVTTIQYVTSNGNACSWSQAGGMVIMPGSVGNLGASSICTVPNPTEVNTYHMGVTYRYMNASLNMSQTVMGEIKAVAQ